MTTRVRRAAVGSRGNGQRVAFWRTVLDVSDPREVTPATPPAPRRRAPRGRRGTVHTAAPRCELCRRPFKQRGDLLRHVRVTHLGERNYHCSVCGSSFGRRSVLNKHQKRHQRDSAARRVAAATAAAMLPTPGLAAAAEIIALMRTS